MYLKETSARSQPGLVSSLRQRVASHLEAGILALATLLSLAASPLPPPAGRVQLELIADPKAPITSQQEWLRRLKDVGVTGLRIRSGSPGGRPTVEVQGSPDNPTYVVTGYIGAGNELVLPGGTYRLSEADQVARWVRQLLQRGPNPEPAKPSSPFGLSDAQFQATMSLLGQPVEFSTKGLNRAAAVNKLGQQLKVRLEIPSGLLAPGTEDPVAEELLGLSAGTALACLLRPAGLYLVPQPGPEHAELTIRKATKGLEVWPVGWDLDKPLPEVLPAMFESFNANIQNVAVEKVLDALSSRLKTPILCDHNALARHGIELGQKTVSVAQSRTTCNQLLRRVLSQAGLKSEVRVDEAGKPFIWITTIKPL